MDKRELHRPPAKLRHENGMRPIQRVTVLGSGTMGSRIAAHFANAGIRALLLDLPSGDSNRSAIARKGLDTALKQRPTPLFTSSAIDLIELGNYEDDLGRIQESDWIIEAVTENLEIKRDLWQRVDQHRAPHAILSTNTSGIPIREIASGFSESFQKQFLGTHFFNPPRYLHLLELIPAKETNPAVLEDVRSFSELRLGKGIVVCKDTPAFIANRIGSFFGAATVKAMMEGDYSIEEVDAITGPLIGVPKSATFRLFDIVGLDVWAYVMSNLHDALSDDPWRDWFISPPFVHSMLKNGWLGEKTGQGFYKRVGPGKQREVIDWRTLEYHPVPDEPALPALKEFNRIPDFNARIRRVASSFDRAGLFVWNVLKQVFSYSAAKLGEICDRVVDIDRAMCWGYGHRLGPFELWDALGFEATARRMEAEGVPLAEYVTQMLQEGAPSFYRSADHLSFPHTEYFDLGQHGYVRLEQRTGVVSMSAMKRARGVVEKNPGASLVDLGHGVLCLEFHSKMNAIGDEALAMFDRAIEVLAERFEALVIANEGENFSVGANLVHLLAAASSGSFGSIEKTIQHFQTCMQRVKYAPRPVVAAVFSRALGGGCEIVLHSHRVQASAETYMGLVEVGVGLIPAAGGCKEMLLRFEGAPETAFERIGQAMVSASAEDARRLGFLRDCDRVSMNPEFLIGDAKRFAIELVKGYQPGAPRRDVRVSGTGGYARMRLAAWSLRESGYITDHDFTIGEKLAHVLTGGNITPGTLVSEQYLLDLEREAFLSLLGMPKTQQRIAHMLKEGKPLRN
jgi:3-hydroxyacyl-CoA dehydrogenase